MRGGMIQIPLLAGHKRPASETPFKWRFAGGPMVAQLWMLACKLCGFYRGSGLILLRNPIFLWLGRDPLSPPLDPHMFMYLSICINPFIRNCVWKLKLKSIRGPSTLLNKNSYETKVANEWNDATLLTNPLPASSLKIFACWAMITSFGEPSKTQVTERDKSIYMYKIGAFLLLPTTYVSAHAYFVEPDKISRIMYLIMFWSVTSRSSNGKWAIAWENLSWDWLHRRSKWIYHTHTRIQRSGPPPPPRNKQVLY